VLQRAMTSSRTLAVPLLRLLTLAYLLASISACAAGGSARLYFQSFVFDASSDARRYGQPEIDVLDYAYGDSHQFGTFRSSNSKELGEAISQGSVAGYLPRADFIWFKWRVKASGQVYEDRVDLRKRLPADLANYGIHVLIEGEQLYVYAFPPFKTLDLLGNVSITAGQPAIRVQGQLFGDVPYNREHQIYPDAAN
jgi:hypothetical protein